MTKDLEETLDGLGPEYRAVVARLRGCAVVPVPRCVLARGAVTAGPGDAAAGDGSRYGGTAKLGDAAAGGGSRYGAWLRAAALALLLFLPCAIFNLSNLSNPSNFSNPSTFSVPSNPYRLAETATPAAIAEILRTQRADGGWATDFLTRRNAQALKGQPGSAAQLAYRKATRNLRLRGLL